MLVGIIGNTGKPDVPAAIGVLVEILDRRSVDFLLHDQLEVFPALTGVAPFVSIEELRDRADLMVAFGGDGTMLSTSRMIAGSGVPLLGVNLGKLGFLAEFSLDSIEQTIDEFLAGECIIVERSLLKASFPDNVSEAPLLALNDIVVDKSGTTRILRLETYINGDYLGTYNADGLILATPTGSTAYALAVGGPIVIPSAQVTLIAPIAPHMLTARPVVVPDTATIEIYPKLSGDDELARIIADGQTQRNIPAPMRVSITRHEQTASLVKRRSTTYFDILRAKLLWGREPILTTQQTTPDDKL
jgi:NAD+ kinase